MRRHSLRTLALALGVSLLIHAAIFWFAPWREKLLAPKPRPPAIDAALIELPAPTAPVPTAPIAPSRPARAEEHRSATPPPKAAPQSQPVAIAHSESQDDPLASQSDAGVSSASPGSAGRPESAAIGAAQGAVGAPSSAPAPAVDDRLARIQAILAARAASCYPPAAARLGIGGTATIHFCVEAGAAAQVKVAAGSGEAMLDRAAADCVVKGAAPLPQIDRCLDVPVRFEAR